ncbi:hypothetical protein LAJ19_10830 [Deinococcus taeanensis]|uniref:TubC N-terminal docking domain-related protein n=1 Tax=Deinococcus taeanensis TaxID=2737050 RepID=UPI001CDD5F02|nr:hypothetical protein [Deinococcus taeanensis]UBV42123.1 hypothetical protein LAJ19_10830 [Deinococcus taeanensis]
MLALELLRELEGRGVRLAIDGGQLVARAPQGAITPELAAQLKAQKAALMAALQNPGTTPASMPDALVRLIQAAVGNHLNFPAVLPGGVVANLGEYVLSSAALYAAGVEPARQLQALWAARGAWAA